MNNLSASFGVTEYSVGDSFSDIVTRADKAVYWAKTQGKNRVGYCFYESDKPEDVVVENSEGEKLYVVIGDIETR